METKAELISKLKAIEEQESQELINEWYPKFAVNVGKFFKKENCYSMPQTKDDWWVMYIKVYAIIEVYSSLGTPRASYSCTTFQTDKNGLVSIEFSNHVYSHSLGEEITSNEYYAALDKLKQQIALI